MACARLVVGPIQVGDLDLGGDFSNASAALHAYHSLDPHYNFGQLYDAARAARALLHQCRGGPGAGTRVLTVDSRMRPDDLWAALKAEPPPDGGHVCFQLTHDPCHSAFFLRPPDEMVLGQGSDSFLLRLRCLVTYADNLRQGGHYHTWEHTSGQWLSLDGVGPLHYEALPADMPVMAVSSGTD